MKLRKVLASATAASLMAAALGPAAHAHTGIGEVSGFAAGFGHPFTGLDHLLAMVAAGLWAAQIGGRATWKIPAAFVGVMLLGGAAGMLGVRLPFVEQGIVASVLALGALVAVAWRWPAAAGAALVGLFAFFHGHAHGSEMPPGAGALAYSAGFGLATALLHLTGIALAEASRRVFDGRLTRLAGGAIALLGLGLAAL